MSETESSYDFSGAEESISHQYENNQQYSQVVSSVVKHLYRAQNISQPEHYRQEHNESSDFQQIEPPISFLQQTFNQLDQEGKGVITKSVLKRATMMTSDQYDKRIIKQQIDKCDRQINYSRFIQIFQRANIGNGGVNQWLYSLYDSEYKGYINSSDLKRVSEITGIDLSEQQIAQMLATQRNGGSGKVDYSDFKYIMQEQIQYM